MAELARILLHQGRDPFTPPQTKIEWVPSSIPGIPAPKLQCKFMMSKVEIVIEGPDEEDVRREVVDCLRDGATRGLVVGLISAYASGGTAAVSVGLATFVASVESCLEAKLGRELTISARIENDARWDEDWGSC